MHRVDEVHVDLDRHLGHVKGRFERRVIMARVGEELELLELRVQRGGVGVAELARALVVGLEGVFTQRAIGAHQHGDERAVRQRVDLALCVGHVGIAHVGIVEHAERAVRAFADLTRGGENLFALGRKDVCLAAAQLVDAAAIGLELRLLGVETRKRLVGDGHDLAGFKRARAVQRDRRGKRLAAHALIEGIAHVLVAAAARVLHELRNAHVDLIAEREPVEQRLRALAELAGVGGHALGVGLERFELFVPFIVARKYVTQIPGELLGHLAAREDRLSVHRFTVLFSIFLTGSVRRLRSEPLLRPIITDGGGEYKRFSPPRSRQIRH